MCNIVSIWCKHLVCAVVIFYSLEQCACSNTAGSQNVNREQSNIHFLKVGFHEIVWNSLVSDNSHSGPSISDQCKNALTDLKIGIKNSELWALKMLDATGKPIEGVLDGNVASLGDYDECLSIKAKGITEFDGAYCMIRVQNIIKTNTSELFGAIDLPDDEVLANRLARVYFAYGACLPSLCSPQDVSTLAQHYLEPYSWKIIAEPFCSTVENKKFDFQRLSFWQKASFIWLSLILGSVLAATFVDFICGNGSALVDAISMKRNWTRLWSEEVHEAPRVQFIDFCRVVFLVLEILPHSAVFVAMEEGFYLMATQENVSVLVRNPLLTFLMGTTAQSIMYALSGITSSLSALKLLNSKNALRSGLKQIVIRYLKFFPILCCTMALQILMPFTASGPAFDHTITTKAETCSKHGWKTLAMISNWDLPFNMCIPVFWSISVDFQLYVLLIINIMILSKNKAAGMTFSGILFSLGIIIPTYRTYIHNLPILGAPPFTLSDTLTIFLNIHFSTYAQLSIFFFPLIVLYMRSKGFRVPISKGNQQLLHNALICVSIAVCFINTPWIVWGWKGSTFVFVLVELIRRPLLLMGVFGVCMFDDDIGYLLDYTQKDVNDNQVNGKTTKNTDTPLRKRSYFYVLAGRLLGPIYLSHQFFIIWDHLTSRNVLPSDLYSLITRGLHSEIGAFGLGIVFYLLIMAPLSNLMQGKRLDSKIETIKSD